jgi:hypothetical protein
MWTSGSIIYVKGEVVEYKKELGDEMECKKVGGK